MPTPIDDLRAVWFVLPFDIRVKADAMTDGALRRLVKMLHAYDALAPDWTNAPSEAHYAVVMPNGDGYWSLSEAVVYEFDADWIFAPATDERWREGPLPLGIDWRLCKWNRPRAEDSA